MSFILRTIGAVAVLAGAVSLAPGQTGPAASRPATGTPAASTPAAGTPAAGTGPATGAVALPAGFRVPPPEVRFEYGTAGWEFPPATPVNTTSPRTVDLLGQAMKAAAGGQRLQYIQEIGLCALPAGTGLLRPLFGETDPLVLAQACHSAALNKDPALLGEVKKLLGHKDAEVRREALLAVLALSKDEQEKAAAVQAALAEVGNPRIVVAALRRAGAGSADAIAGRVAGYPEPLQAEALGALGRVKAEKHAGLVAGFLDKSIPLRGAALEALGAMKARGQLPAVVKQLGHEHPTVRRDALKAVHVLAEAGEQQRHALDRLKNDPDPTVRQAACTILVAHPLTEAVDDLVKQLDTPYRPLHREAREALVVGHMPAEMKQACIAWGGRLLKREDNRRRQEDGSYILGRHKSNHEIDYHVKLLADVQDPKKMVDWALVTQVAWSLGWIGDPKATGPIVPLLARAPHKVEFSNAISEYLAEALFVAAGKFKLKDAIPQANRILGGRIEDQLREMRGAAVFAVHKISDASDPAAIDRLLRTAQFGGEGGPTRLEALKGLAERRATRLLPQITALAETDGEAMTRGAAHWVRDYLTGKTTTAYTPPQSPWEAEVSIRDIPNR